MERKVISPSGKYIVLYEDDPDKEQSEYYISRDKYYIVKLINTEDMSSIYQYKCERTHRICCDFININGQEWWFGGRDYTTRLFVNCETGEMYDSCHEDVDINYIWAQIAEISSNGKYVLVDGCIWACPYQWRLYDISDIKHGYKEIDLLNDVEIYDIYDKKMDFYSISDSDDYNLSFSSDNKISIYNKKRELIGYAVFS